MNNYNISGGLCKSILPLKESPTPPLPTIISPTPSTIPIPTALLFTIYTPV